MSPEKQKHVLFVDDEINFLETIRVLFTTWSKDTWQIEGATSAEQALEMLKGRAFDLIVVDVNMPVLDGVQFLRILSRRYPDLKKAVTTGYATEERRSACLANGAELFIEKPHSSEGLKSIFVMLEELLTWKQQAGFQGMLRQVGLQDVIQMECLGRNSCILEVNNQQLTGRIYIEDGSIIHAVAGEQKGEVAFQKLLSLKGGSFQLQHFEPPDERTMQGQWEFLLMEAARVQDESASQASLTEPVAGHTEHVARPADPAIAQTAPIAGLPPLAGGSAVPAAGRAAPVQAPAYGTEPAAAEAPARVAETVICSGNGALLYQWQCYDVGARLALLEEIARQAALLGKVLPLGNFDRLEIQLSGSRAVAQVRADRLLFVQVNSGNGTVKPTV